MLKKRLITALCGIPFLAAIVWFGDPWFTILVAVWGLLAVFEFYRLVANTKVPPLTFIGLFLTLLFIVSPHIEYASFVPMLFSSIVLIPLVWLVMRKRKEIAFERWAWTIAGVLYIGWLLSHLVSLRDLDAGRNLVFFALFITFASDAAAFFVGTAIGKTALAPNISPRKTWEGAIGGILGAILMSLVFASDKIFMLTNPLSIPLFGYWQAIILSIAVSIFSQFGDLAESLFKRNMGVKESGKTIPGHGGFLDRIDSVLFAVVVVYYFVIWLL